MRFFTLLSIFGIVAESAEAGNRLRPTCPPTRCCLPGYDYHIHDTSNPVSATARGVFSEIRVIDRTAGYLALAGTQDLEVRVFQLDVPKLESDHCSISQATLTLFEDGRWIAQFQAKQDPRQVETQRQPRFFVYKRNQFIVSLRGQGLAPVTDDPNTGVIGEPEFFKICLTPFWMEQGETRNVRVTGTLKAGELRGFEQLTQVCVDLQYR